MTTSDSYTEAFKLARRAEFSFYIIDNTLPDGNGVDLCRAIRTFFPNTAIIFCSGYTDPEHQKMAEECGARAFLAKPFDSDDLLTTRRHDIER